MRPRGKSNFLSFLKNYGRLHNGQGGSGIYDKQAGSPAEQPSVVSFLDFREQGIRVSYPQYFSYKALRVYLVLERQCAVTVAPCTEPPAALSLSFNPLRQRLQSREQATHTPDQILRILYVQHFQSRRGLAAAVQDPAKPRTLTVLPAGIGRRSR